MAFDAVIEVRSVSKRFGGLLAVSNCSLEVERGSITGLIGPNGAGKSTLFNMVAGNFAPTSGQIIFDGQDITGLKPHELFRLGMLRTFQIAHEFSQMTALENLMMVPGDQPARAFRPCGSSRAGLRRARRRCVRKHSMSSIFSNSGM